MYIEEIYFKETNTCSTIYKKMLNNTLEISF